MQNKTAYTAIEEMGKINMKTYGMERPYPTSAGMFEFKNQRFWEKNARGKREISCKRSELEAHAVNFIRNRCVGLRFKKDDRHINLKDSDGKSLKPNQIPYNMEMDIDRRCLEVAIHRFLESGVAKDAFDIYYIFLEMFISSYGSTREMIEMLSEFETNASSLLMKHRDHYSHSVYVFLIGLAYYDSSESYREEYKKHYKDLLPLDNLTESDEDLAAHFLKYWGISALFHDIGYPFELSFEQVKSYFRNNINYVPFVMYNMNNYLVSEATYHIPKMEKELEEAKKRLSENDSGINEKDINNYKRIVESYTDKMNTLKRQQQEAEAKLKKMLPAGYNENVGDDLYIYLADALEQCLGTRYEDSKMYKAYLEKNPGKKYRDYLENVLSERNDPSKCNGFIDHAFFSAVMLTVNLLKTVDLDKINMMYTNAITAILLHNSFYKFSVTNYKSPYNNAHRFTVDISPLAFLLMLCDEIQCWDRTSYGKNSRGQIHPMNCRISFKGDKMDAVYVFDSKYFNKDENGNLSLKEEYAGVKGTYSKIAGDNEFLKDIESIVSINGDNSFGSGAAKTELSVSMVAETDNRYRRTYLSSSNFLHLYTMAYKVHQMNHPEISDEEMEQKFNELSLEYKMTHIGRAKKYARYLHEINCFYSDKQPDFEVVNEITDDDKNTDNALDRIGELEHDRWCFDHYAMGWIAGKDYDIADDKAVARERMRIHKDMIDTSEGYSQENAIRHYHEGLDDTDRKKDKRPINNFLKVLARDDGIRGYRLDLKKNGNNE